MQAPPWLVQAWHIRSVCFSVGRWVAGRWVVLGGVGWRWAVGCRQQLMTIDMTLPGRRELFANFWPAIKSYKCLVIICENQNQLASSRRNSLPRKNSCCFSCHSSINCGSSHDLLFAFHTTLVFCFLYLYYFFGVSWAWLAFVFFVVITRFQFTSQNEN